MRRAPAAPARSSVPATTRAPQTPALPPAAQPKQPGLFGQMAATAGGVAIGSAVVRTLKFMSCGCLLCLNNCKVVVNIGWF